MSPPAGVFYSRKEVFIYIIGFDAHQSMCGHWCYKNLNHPGGLR